MKWLKPLNLGVFVEDWLLYIFGYSAVFMAGLRFRKASVWERLIVLAVALVVMAAIGCHISAEQGTWIYFQPIASLLFHACAGRLGSGERLEKFAEEHGRQSDRCVCACGMAGCIHCAV